MKLKQQLARNIATSVLIGIMLITPIPSKAGQQMGIIALVWGPDGSKVATANFDGTLHIWDATKQELLLELKDPADRIDSIAWKPDGTQIASLGGDDGVIRIWNTTSGALVASLPGERDPNGRGIVVWSPDGTKIASVICSDSAPINIWSAENDNYKLMISSGPAAFYTIAWSPDSAKLVVAGILNLYVLDGITTGNLLFHMIGPFAISAAWNPDGTKVAAGDNKGLIHILDAKTGKETNILQGHTDGVINLSWNPDGTQLVSSSQDNTLRIWDTNVGKMLKSVPISNDIIFIAKLADWSPYGGRLAYHGKASTTLSPLTQTDSSAEFQVAVPLPSTNELQAITTRCANANAQPHLTARISAKQFSAFANDVKAMSKDQIPPACAADLIAVANALQTAP